LPDFLGFLKHTLPSMAAAVASGIPGPIGAVAELVTAAIGKKVDPEAKAIADAVANATPDQILKLKEDDQNFKVTMQKMGFDHDEKLADLAVEDRSNARSREVSLKDRFVPYLAAGILLSFVVSVVLVLRGFGKVEAAFAGTLVGYLAANANQVVSYYFGSSAGSDRKTELMAQANN
jgi:hypothetical protein